MIMTDSIQPRVLPDWEVLLDIGPDGFSLSFWNKNCEIISEFILLIWNTHTLKNMWLHQTTYLASLAIYMQLTNHQSINLLGGPDILNTWNVVLFSLNIIIYY